MAQLPCIGLSWPSYKSPPFGSCAIYFHYGVVSIVRITPHLSAIKFGHGGKGNNATIGDVLSIVTNHLLTGMILQVIPEN